MKKRTILVALLVVPMGIAIAQGDVAQAKGAAAKIKEEATENQALSDAQQEIEAMLRMQGGQSTESK